MKQEVKRAMQLVSAFIALIVGKQVDIEWGERAAMSSQGTVHLPLPATGDPTEVALLTRLAVHEAGHALHTEGGFNSRLDSEELGAFNAIEDSRMEAAQGKQFPGAALILSRGLDELLLQLKAKIDGGKDLRVRPVHLDLLLRGSLAMAPNKALQAHAPGILASLTSVIERREREAVDAVLVSLPGLNTSLDAEQLARDFVAQLREAEEQHAEEPSEPSSQTQEPQGDGVSDSTGADDPAPTDSANPSESSSQRDDESPGDGTEPAGPNQPQDEAAAAAESENEAGEQHCAQSGKSTGEPDSEASQSQTESEAPGQEEEIPELGQDADAGEHTSSQHPNGSAGISDQTGQPGAANAAGTVAPEPGTAAGSTPSAEGAGAEAAVDTDLGELLRDAHRARYGGIEQEGQVLETPSQGQPVGADQLERMIAVLSGANADMPLDELLHACIESLEGGACKPDPDASHESNGLHMAGFGLASDMDHGGDKLEVRLQGVQSRLVTVLQRELQDSRKRPTRHTHAGGRISAERFWRLQRVGDTRVFNSRRPAPGIDAAASMLLDKSSSMKNTLSVAAEVALAFSLAMQRIGKVRTRVATFPGSATITETLQHFGESPRACARKCAELVADGGTPLGAAMAQELALLRDQRCSRALLVVITDDQPGDPHVVLQVMGHAAVLGVDVVGVAIGCDISALIPRSITVQTTLDLPEALTRLFREDMSLALTA